MKRKQGATNVTRREFLQQGVATTVTAFAAPLVLSSAGRAAPNERIQVGVIGLGKMGSAHLSMLLPSEQVQVVALCDVESLALGDAQQVVEKHYGEQTASGSYKGCATYRCFEELLARDDIDAVVVATPDHWHALICIAAAQAGKDIYCEKPMVHEIAEGRAVVNAVRRYGRVFQTGSQQRSGFDGKFRRAAELVRNGVLGKLHAIEIGVGPPPADDFELPVEPTPPSLDWDRWVGPAPWRPYSSTLAPIRTPTFPYWRYHRDFGSGDYSDFGAHHFDIAQWALDMDGSGPVEIIPPDGKDVTRLTYVYANGLPMYHGAQTDVVFIGEKGRILVNRMMLWSEPEDLVETRLGPNDIRLDRGLSHQDDWLACIRSRQLPIADVEVGHRTATVCLLGLITYRLNRRLKWDPVAERFPEDDEANRLLSRPMRSPWRLT